MAQSPCFAFPLQLHINIKGFLVLGVAESGDDFTKFSTISQWFQTLIHPALMQRLVLFLIMLGNLKFKVIFPL
ncbi:MAG: hypothetical protein HRU34_14440 [Richelia sp.]|nr:hypothetical protein [Richelia sp.]